MAFYGELTLRAHLGQTRIDVDVDDVHEGYHAQQWRHSFLADVSPSDPAHDVRAWLLGALEPVMRYLAGDHIDAEDQAPAAAAAAAETTLDLGELEQLEP